MVVTLPLPPPFSGLIETLRYRKTIDLVNDKVYYRPTSPTLSEQKDQLVNYDFHSLISATLVRKTQKTRRFALPLLILNQYFWRQISATAAGSTFLWRTPGVSDNISISALSGALSTDSSTLDWGQSSSSTPFMISETISLAISMVQAVCLKTGSVLQELSMLT